MPKSSSPSKKVPSIKADLVKTNLEEIVSQQLPSKKPASSTTPRRSRKRTAVVPDDSDVEIIRATPSPKRRRKSLPPPGSPAFDTLPAVSIPDLVGAAIAARKSPSPMACGDVTENRPKRTIVKTPKARAMEAAQEKKDNSSRSTKDKTMELAQDKSESGVMLDALDVQVSDSDSDLPPISSLLAALDAARVPAITRDSLSPVPLRSDDMHSSPVANVTTGELDDPGDISSEEHAASPRPANCDDQSVMLTPCPDSVLAPFYESLPHLPRMCDVKSFSGTTESLRTPFSDKCAGMSAEGVRIVLKALLFTKSGPYVNTARVDPTLLRVENSRLRIAESKSLAVCIMTGTVTESFLVASAEAGPRHSPYAIHKLSIAPFEQDFRRDTSTWGLLFDFHVITGMISPAGFGFASRGEGKGDSWRTPSAPTSPVKGKSSVLKSVTSAQFSVSPEVASRSFDDTIPVYDGRATKGRKGFTFSDADFKSLATWPIYGGGPTEVPVDAIVSIGYTLGTYRGNAGPVLSSNLIFVILLNVG